MNALDVGVLWIHSLLAVGWGVAVGLLALLALPKGRRLLSDHAGNVFDSRLDAIARGTWWLTALVVLSGVYNLVNSVPYRVPLTPAQVERLFQLPWAQAYYVDLAVKVVLYAAMVAAAVPLMREARRRAGEWSPQGDGAAVPLAGSEVSPWEPVGAGPTSLLVGDTPRPPGGSIALRSPVRERAIPGWEATERETSNVTPFVVLLAAGAVILALAVTLLLYFHRLSEVARAA